MDVPKPNSVDAIIERVIAAKAVGDYNKAIKLLKSIVKHRKLSTQEEKDITILLSTCYRFSLDYKNALPYAQKRLELSDISGALQRDRADAFIELGRVYQGLESYKDVYINAVNARVILDDLNLKEDEQYGVFFLLIADMEYVQTRYIQALELYEKSKMILLQYKDRSNYRGLLNSLCRCYEKLNKWDESISYCRQLVECTIVANGTNHPEYATAINSLATKYAQLKCFERAVPLFESAIIIFQKTYGDQGVITAAAIKHLALVRELAQRSHRESINAEHYYRMCNTCEKIVEHMDSCTACYKVSYCDRDCQLKDWIIHKPMCHVCLHCDTVLSRDSNILRCSRCKKVKYCDMECQKAHWKEHKKDCSSSK